MLHALDKTSLLPKCFGADLARVIRSPNCGTPLLAMEMNLVFNEGYCVLSKEHILKQLTTHFSIEKLRQCDSEFCEKIETIDQHFKCCSRCHVPRYCSEECQEKHWASGHKHRCFDKKK